MTPFPLADFEAWLDARIEAATDRIAERVLARLNGPAAVTPALTRVLSIADAAQLLGMSYGKVHALAVSGTLPARQIGRQWRISEADLSAWVMDQGDSRVVPLPRRGRPAKGVAR